MENGVTVFLAQAATPSGWLGWLAAPMAEGMEWLYGYVPNYGWVIVLLTLALRLLLWPLQAQTNRSQRLMPALAPRVQEIKARNGQDRRQAQREIMALYKENGLNPGAGCLLVLILVFLSLGLGHCRALFWGQAWLWIDDLGRPDSFALFGLPIAPLAIVVAVTFYAISRRVPMGSSLASPWAAAATALLLYFTFNTCISAVALAWAISNSVVLLQTWVGKGKPPAVSGEDAPRPDGDPLPPS